MSAMEAVLTALDTGELDPLHLFAMADLLEERGYEAAWAWRWMGEHEKRPRRIGESWAFDDRVTNFTGSSEQSRLPLERPVESTPQTLWWYTNKLVGGLYENTTRSESYLAAALALHETYPNGEGLL